MIFLKLSEVDTVYHTRKNYISIHTINVLLFYVCTCHGCTPTKHLKYCANTKVSGRTFHQVSVNFRIFLLKCETLT